MVRRRVAPSRTMWPGSCHSSFETHRFAMLLRMRSDIAERGDVSRLPSSCSLQSLRRIDIEERALAIDRNFGHSFGMLGNQMTRADVAVERHQLLEEAARPQHG